jgi:hypothetical protein
MTTAGRRAIIVRFFTGMYTIAHANIHHRMHKKAVAAGILIALAAVIIWAVAAGASPPRRRHRPAGGESYAGSPSHVRSYAEGDAPLNPVTGIGKGSFVRAALDRHSRGEALQRLSIYELEPGRPGHMEEVGAAASNLMAAVARRSPPAAAGAPRPLTGVDIDSDFRTDGFYESAVFKEGLTSSRRPGEPNTLTASRVGLGSTRLDPRFEPGPQRRVATGDASPSPGSHAGGITLGGFGSSKFQTYGGWDWGRVQGFGGDGGGDVPEAMATGRSLW